MKTLQVSLIAVFCLLCGQGVFGEESEDTPVVKVEQGRVRGKRVGSAHILGCRMPARLWANSAGETLSDSFIT